MTGWELGCQHLQLNVYQKIVIKLSEAELMAY